MKIEDGLLIGGRQHGRVCPIRPELMADNPPAWVEYNRDDYRRVAYGGYTVYVSTQVPALRTMTAIAEALK